MASKEYERLAHEAAWEVVGEFWHPDSRTKEPDAGEITLMILERLSNEFEALLDALEGMARATADAMVEETGNAEFADWRQWLTAQADALLRKHGRLA